MGYRKTKRKAIKKETRIIVWNKFDKRCAYCGIELKYKDMQVDHLESYHYHHFHKGKDIDRIENLMPSCRSCNYYKGTYELEGFRREMNRVHIRLTTGKSKFLVNLAVRYGIVILKKFDGKFYFEKMEKKNGN